MAAFAGPGALVSYGLVLADAGECPECTHMNVLTSVPRTLPFNSWQNYILVVEDDAELLDSFRSSLRAAGFAAVGVDDGPGALRLVETQRPSAIVLDLVAHRLDGLEVLRALKSNPQTRDLPVVVVTDADIKDLNFDDVACLLKKPLDTQALVVAVQHVVRQSAPPRLEAS
jgi:CheY-like chemotaxis protein